MRTQTTTSLCFDYAMVYLLSHRQILGTGNLPQDSAPVCINIDGEPTKPSILCHRS